MDILTFKNSNFMFSYYSYIFLICSEMIQPYIYLTLADMQILKLKKKHAMQINVGSVF